MVYWEMPAINHDKEGRRYNHFPADGHCKTEFGIGAYISDMCEWVRTRSSKAIMGTWCGPGDAWIVVTWICIDYSDPELTPRSLKTFRWPPFNIRFLTIYPPPDRSKRLNDFFNLRLSLADATNCPFYSDDREVFADRLLHKIHECWVESWKLADKVESIRLPKWPVKLWIHGHPEHVWEIADDDTLRLIPDHPPVDETIILPVIWGPKPSPPATPADFQAVAVSELEVRMRWRPVPDVDGYYIMFSDDGETFVHNKFLAGDESKPGLDGFCIYIDRTGAEAPIVYYSVKSIRDLHHMVSSEPAPPVRVRLR